MHLRTKRILCFNFFFLLTRSFYFLTIKIWWHFTRCRKGLDFAWNSFAHFILKRGTFEENVSISVLRQESNLQLRTVSSLLYGKLPNKFHDIDLHGFLKDSFGSMHVLCGKGDLSSNKKLTDPSEVNVCQHYLSLPIS